MTVQSSLKRRTRRIPTAFLTAQLNFPLCEIAAAKYPPLRALTGTNGRQASLDSRIWSTRGPFVQDLHGNPQSSSPTGQKAATETLLLLQGGLGAGTGTTHSKLPHQRKTTQKDQIHNKQ